MKENRYIGDYPIIGIRPAIDGRRGPMQLRESLEDQTMNMALAAKKLFEENLYYSNGEPVKVIIADICICVPEKETFKVQELHLPVYHYLCAEVENRFFN